MSWRSSLVSFFFFVALRHTAAVYPRKAAGWLRHAPDKTRSGLLIMRYIFCFSLFFCCFVCVRFQTLSSSIHVTPPMPTVGVLETDSRVFSLFISLFKKRLKRVPRGLFGFLVSETVLYCLFSLSSMLKCIYLSDTR